MKTRIVWLLLGVLVLGCSSGFAAEAYNTVFIDGAARITIDGDLSDWEPFGVAPLAVDVLKAYQKQEPPVLNKELSGVFRCCADLNNVYAAFVVTDDRLVFGRARPGKPFWDDLVEIMVFNDSVRSENGELEVAKIWVSATGDGLTKLEGREPPSGDRNFPYLRSELGIRGVLSLTGDGYVAELKIPRTVLEEWSMWGSDRSMKANVRVYDDDSEGEQNFLEWAENIGDSMSAFSEIVFSDVITVEEDAAASKDDGALEIVLSEPDKAVNVDEYVVRQLESDMKIAGAFEKNRKYSWAAERFEKIVADCPLDDVRMKARLALARNYFFMNEFDKSQQVCEDILGSGPDKKTKLDADMIIMSIERKNAKK